MPDLREGVDQSVLAIQDARSDEEARAVEASLLEQSDNGLHPGDPEEQPPFADRPDPGRGRRRGAGDVDRVIARLESQLGTVESPAGSNGTIYCDWYGLTGPWCAMFVSWCFFNEGLPLPASTSKGFAYTPAGAQWFKNQGRWSDTPQRGHVVFFDFPKDSVNRISHVGVVTGVNPDGTIDTIEGNTDERGGRTGGKVMRRRRGAGIVGYGVPNYQGATGTSGGKVTEGRPPWAHPHGPVIKASHGNCSTVRQWQQRMAVGTPDHRRRRLRARLGGGVPGVPAGQRDRGGRGGRPDHLGEELGLGRRQPGARLGSSRVPGGDQLAGGPGFVDPADR